MIHWETLKNTLHGWAVAQSGYDAAKVIWAEQNTAAPALPYLSLKITSLTQIKGGYIDEPDNNGIARISWDREFTLALQAFGGQPMAVLEKLEYSLQRFEVKLGLPEGLAYLDSKGIQSTTALVGSSYEERAAMDLRFRITSEFGADGTTAKPFTTDEVGLIETVIIKGKGTYEHPGGDEVGG